MTLSTMGTAAATEGDMGKPNDATEAFQRLIEALGASATMAWIDLANAPDGVHWLDLTVDGVPTNVAYRPDKGYGLFTGSEDDFGSNPDEIVNDPVEAAQRLREIVASHRATPVQGTG